DDSILVADHPVARRDLYVPDRDRLLCCLELPRERRVLRVDVAAEDREPELDDEAHVPAAAVEHATSNAAGRERGDGELAEMGGDRVIARVHRDVTGRN